MVHYILQTIAFQVFFLLVYDLFLKKETFFNWNRTYLLSTSVLSFMLPFVKIKALQESIPKEFIITLPEIVISTESNQFTETILLDTIVITSQSVSYMQWLFFIGLSVSLVLFGLKLYRIFRLFYTNPKIKNEGFRVVNLIKSKAAFSFLNYIFIGEKIDQQEAVQILEHEKIHVQQKHSLDLLYFEVLRILFWFNPLIYIYQNRTSELHEFIADAKASKAQNKSDYYQNLLSQIFDTKNVSFINTFFKQSLIKKRIIMLSKKQSRAILKFKYALLIPVVLGMLMYTSCTQEVVSQEARESNKAASSDILKNIAILKESIAAKGNMTEEEEKSLKTLMMLISPNGLNDPFFKDVVDRAEIPFGVIQQIPLYPGCESQSKEDQRNCMAQKVTNHVVENFNTKLGDDKSLKGKQKIYVQFIISNTGEVKDVKARAAHKALEIEAKRVIKLLPKMTPGMQEGKAVNVPYSLPIMFVITE